MPQERLLSLSARQLDHPRCLIPKKVVVGAAMGGEVEEEGEEEVMMEEEEAEGIALLLQRLFNPVS